MSILILERPDKIHLYSGNTSKFNAVHNVIQYRLRRMDYSVLYGIPVEGNFIRITIPKVQYDEQPIAVGDELFVSTVNKSAKVVSIAFSPAFAFVTVGELFVPGAGNPGYANNMTSRKMFRLECKLFIHNNKTNLTETAATFESFPDTSGNITLIIQEYLKKYVSNKNESDYTGTNYNDINAWCKFYIGYRSVWVGNENESFYEDRINPYLGPNIISNGTFDTDLTGWDYNDMFWDSGKIRKSPNLSAAYLRPDNFSSFPTIAGVSYKISFLVSDTVGTYSSVNAIYLRLTDPSTMLTGTPQVCGLSGTYEMEFTALANGDFPIWEFGNAYFASIDNIKMQAINSSLDNTPIWRYCTKSVNQIHSKYNGNLALFDAHFDTLDALNKRAKFICDFVEPTWYSGFPFDIAVLFDESMVVSDVKRKEEIFNVNVATAINEYTLSNKKVGEQRIHLNGGYTSGIKKLKVWLEVGDVVNDEYVNEEYVDDGYMTVNEGSDPAPAAEEGEITERRTVRIGSVCQDNPVYLAWKGKQGGWSYYLFYKTQDITTTLSEQSVAEPYIDNLDTTGNKYQIDISSSPSITMGCSNIDRNDVDGILKMLESGCIRVYLGAHETTGLPEWEDLIVKQGSFKISTGNMRHDIEFTLDKPFNYTHSS